MIKMKKLFNNDKVLIIELLIIEIINHYNGENYKMEKNINYDIILNINFFFKIFN